MAEHVCEWEAVGNYSGGSEGARCKVRGCRAELSYQQVDDILNEHATLERENERYERGFVYTSENGRELLVKMWNDEPWIFYKHPDGQWVSLKKIALLTAEESGQ